MKTSPFIVYTIILFLMPSSVWAFNPSLEELDAEMMPPLAFTCEVNVTTINTSSGSNPPWPDFEAVLGIAVESGNAQHIIDWDAGIGRPGDKELVEQSSLLVNHFGHHYTTPGTYTIKVYGCIEDYIEIHFDKQLLTNNVAVGELDISQLPNLVELRLENNDVTSIDWGVNNKTKLYDVRLTNNSDFDGDLDMTGWNSIVALYARGCKIENIFLGPNNSNLQVLAADRNRLNLGQREIDITHCPNLAQFEVQQSSLSFIKMNSTSNFYEDMDKFYAFGWSSGSPTKIKDHNNNEIPLPLTAMQDNIRDLRIYSTNISGIDASGGIYPELQYINASNSDFKGSNIDLQGIVQVDQQTGEDFSKLETIVLVGNDIGAITMPSISPKTLINFDIHNNNDLVISGGLNLSNSRSIVNIQITDTDINGLQLPSYTDTTETKLRLLRVNNANITSGQYNLSLCNEIMDIWFNGPIFSLGTDHKFLKNVQIAAGGYDECELATMLDYVVNSNTVVSGGIINIDLNTTSNPNCYLPDPNPLPGAKSNFQATLPGWTRIGF